MGRRTPVTAEGWRKRDEDREQRLAALRIRLQEAAHEVRTAAQAALEVGPQPGHKADDRG